MFYVFDQNAPRKNGKVPIVAKHSTIEGALKWVKDKHGKIDAEAPPFGPGLLVYVNKEYCYFVGPIALQGAIELSGRKGLEKREEHDEIELEALIELFRDAVENRDPATLCITLQVAFPA